MIIVNSYLEFLTRAQHAEKVLLLVYKPEDEQNQNIYRNLEIVSKNDRWAPVFVVDANRIQDINSIYEIDIFPSLLIFHNGRYQKIISGCREIGFYLSLNDCSDTVLKPRIKVVNEHAMAELEKQQ
jgi:hypothetical protein